MEGKRGAGEMSFAITADSISCRFAEKLVLNRVTFQIEKGEIFGLLGPSGAGKTTLVRILTGQLPQESGYAELLGVDTRRLDGLLRRKIGAMMDNFGLYGRLSAQDNLAFYAELGKIPRSTVLDTLKKFGLYEARKTPVSKLSKGMKNRLSLARALMSSPAVLFLDEPTAGLDPATKREIHEILRSQREKGTTIFLTTHDMQEAESLCDHIALLSKGCIIEFGSPESICRKHNRQNKLALTLKDGRKLCLENGSRSAPVIRDYLEHGLIETIHSTEPTLDDVFVQLTGRGLWENA